MTCILLLNNVQNVLKLDKHASFLKPYNLFEIIGLYINVFCLPLLINRMTVVYVRRMPDKSKQEKPKQDKWNQFCTMEGQKRNIFIRNVFPKRAKK